MNNKKKLSCAPLLFFTQGTHVQGHKLEVLQKIKYHFDHTYEIIQTNEKLKTLNEKTMTKKNPLRTCD